MISSMLLSCAILAAPADPAITQFQTLERSSGGRLGISVLDTGSGHHWNYRANERFPMCSTFKVILAGEVLAEVDAGRMGLHQQIPFTSADLLDYAPAVRAFAGDGSMSLEDLCRAVVEVSDNTAANLLLRSLGGTTAFNGFSRRIGDAVTHLDRLEPELNEATPGDPRDTSSPEAMCNTLRELLQGGTLSASSHTLLSRWMANGRMGARRLKAGFPADWDVRDKTGVGQHGTTNDIAMVTPPGRPPIFVAAFLTGTKIGNAEQDHLLAEVGRIIAKALAAQAP
jgi:beta-lactamase class A